MSARTTQETPADPTPGANNALSNRCGLKIALVIDRSFSTHDFDSDYKGAADAFINGLVGTPSHIGIVTFAASASLLSGYVPMSGGDGGLIAQINGLPAPVSGPTGFTNWQAAFELTTSSFTTPVPDLVVFITDGVPTTKSSGLFTNLGAGIDAANTLKNNQHTHITGVGVGDVTLANIGDVTGTGSIIDPPSDLAGHDVYQTANPANLAAEMKKLATTLCGGSVTIHKSVQTGPNTFVPGGGWQFASSTADDTPVTTNSSGIANLKFSEAGTKLIAETVTAGYTIKSVDCGQGQVSNVGPTGFDVVVNNDDIIACEVVNMPPPPVVIPPVVVPPVVAPPVVVPPVVVTTAPVHVEAALAFTGSASGPLAALGALLVGLGAFALVLSRRRPEGAVID